MAETVTTSGRVYQIEMIEFVHPDNKTGDAWKITDEHGQAVDIPISLLGILIAKSLIRWLRGE